MASYDGESTFKFASGEADKDEVIQMVQQVLKDEKPDKKVTVARENMRNSMVKVPGTEIEINGKGRGPMSVEFPFVSQNIKNRLTSELDKIAGGDTSGSAVPSSSTSGKLNIQEIQDADPDNERRVERIQNDEINGIPQGRKPYNKTETNYERPGRPNYDRSRDKCKDCAAFYDGACILVEGNIEPDGYCDLQSDMAFFGKVDGRNAQVKTFSEGDGFDWTKNEAEMFVQELVDAMKQIIR